MGYARAKRGDLAVTMHFLMSTRMHGTTESTMCYRMGKVTSITREGLVKELGCQHGITVSFSDPSKWQNLWVVSQDRFDDVDEVIRYSGEEYKTIDEVRAYLKSKLKEGNVDDDKQ